VELALEREEVAHNLLADGLGVDARGAGQDHARLA
jgi:hypothetical protein